MVTFQDFKQLDIRIGRIVEVADHPDADKLYVLKVDIGNAIIQLVAGIKKSYTADELQGKSIVVLTNLEPKELRGIESQGMLLAAQGDDIVTVLTPDKEVSCGSVIR